MNRRTLRTGKKQRPKTAEHGYRYRCRYCHKRSPKRVLAAPYVCPACAAARQ